MARGQWNQWISRTLGTAGALRTSGTLGIARGQWISRTLRTSRALRTSGTCPIARIRLLQHRGNEYMREFQPEL
ncbi:MAG TPA: hypothetical protein VEF34_09275 [Syntrophobacteraceae bacterium]|nr:hypothetical protein [Syntrophobacteraceae bacterium]